MDLADFLLARIAEDEERVRGGLPYAVKPTDDEEDEDPTAYDRWDEGRSSAWHTEDCGYRQGEFSEPCSCTVPARLLAECEAKRRIVAVHQASVRAVGEGLSAPTRKILRALALPYRDHRDYRQEWAVTDGA